MRLLVSKPDSLGDQFIAAGCVQALRRLRPDVRVVWHVRAGMEAIAPLVGAEVFVPQIQAAPEAEASRLAAHPAPLIVLPYPLSPHEPWTNELRARVAWWASFLRATSWDATLLALVNRNWVGDLTVAVAPAPVRIGCTANAMIQPLVNEAAAQAGSSAPAFTATLPPSFLRSETEQLRDLFAVIEPRLAPDPLWQPAAAWQPRVSARPRILVAPGVGGDARRAWGGGNLSRVVDPLRTRGAAIGWIAGPGDEPYFAGLPVHSTDTRLEIPSNALSELVDALLHADLFLCHDTSYVHVAAGLGVPTVAIFGAGQHGRFHPIGGRVKIVQSQIACAGCQWHCLWERLVCVADIPVDTVAAAVGEMLAGNSETVTVRLASPVANAPEGESAAVQRRLQEEVLALNSDRFARLQIIQSLLALPPQPAVPQH